MKLSVSLPEADVAVLDDFARASGLKTRSAVVVSNDRANATAQRLGRGVVAVVPVTSNVSRVLPFQTLLTSELTGLRIDSKAQAEQVRSVAVERVGAVVGHVPPAVMAEVDDALRLHLGL